jgi:putative hydrolase of the HAD superfamily
MFPFDVILFDVGGVLLTNGWDHGERAAAVAHFGLDAAVFYQPRTFSRSEFFSFMLAQSRKLSHGALHILAELAESNACMVGALNNEARETNEFRFAHFGLRRYFKVAFSSCYVGLRKPELAIYLRALDILGCLPERVLFIDDRRENVAGGLAAGMKAIQFTGADALRAELQELGVF